MLRLIAPLISGIASGSVKSAVKRTRDQVICYAVVGFALIVALIFLCVTAFIALTWVVKPIFAGAILCGFWVGVALIALLIGRTIAAKRKKIYEKQLDEERGSLIVASVASAIPALFGNKKVLKIAIPLISIAALSLWNKSKHKKK
ncbi:phage holin family protein [Bartonella tamiae]|uniref:Phage holin family protein n=1 Tax=Bartonella tamiae Th239 TaxID=1094558 RepID=J0QZW8_9HYPH|nr:phage holin family protein [Bartonella tamiae]EJF91726.1 hypothetical protein ME5_00105 [Bartonella tamiae Th239]EJF92606.1 hypothetical protein MEG_01776 [Bartonella tamiae Th307]